MAKMSEKEILFRQWYKDTFGGDEAPTDSIADIDRAYAKWMKAELPSAERVSFNFVMRKVRDIISEIQATGNMVDAEELNVIQHVSKHLQPSGDGKGDASDPVQAEVEYELNVETIDDMDFPDFTIYKTGTTFDRLWSDMDEEGGMYSGTVNIVTGESGVGKTTLLIDFLAKIRRTVLEEREINPDLSMSELIESGVDEADLFEPLFISSEMTRNDIFFFKEKMPIIGPVATFIASDHIRTRTLAKALQDLFFNKKHAIILLDSYKDTVEKLKDIYDWSEKYAGNFLINLMIEAAEKFGTTILAVQHQTKGGQYTGSTYLKHTTTAMLELMFAEDGKRYAQFSKNRRSGSMTHVPLFFSIDKEKNECVYDETKFNTFMRSRNFSSSSESDASERENRFKDIFRVLKEQTIKNEPEHKIDDVNLDASELRLPQIPKRDGVIQVDDGENDEVLTPFTDRINIARAAAADEATIIEEDDE